MEIKMPYGVVTVNTIQDAVGFVLNHCRECQFSNEMTRCSGADVNYCNEQVNKVISSYSKKGANA